MKWLFKADVLDGWKKVHAVNNWPLVASAIVPMGVPGSAPVSLYFGLAYSVIAWTLLGIAVYETRVHDVVYNQFEYPKLMVVEDCYQAQSFLYRSV